MSTVYKLVGSVWVRDEEVKW